MLLQLFNAKWLNPNSNFMSKLVIKVLGIIALCSAVLTSCNEDEYSMPTYKPIVGFHEQSKTISATNYLDNGTVDVSFKFSANRLPAEGSVTFSVQVESVSPEGITDLFTLAANQVTLKSQEVLDQNLGSVNWSKLSPGQEAVVTLAITPVDGIDLAPTTKRATIKLSKQEAPQIWLDKTKKYSALIPLGYTEPSKVFNLSIPMTSSSNVLADINVPIRVSLGGMEEGVHFSIPSKIMTIKKGTKTASLAIEVFAAAFSAGQVKPFYIEIHQEDLSQSDVAVVDETYWWTTIEVGKEGVAVPTVFLDKTATYDALMDADFAGDEQIVNVDIPVSSTPLPESVVLPIRLNEYNVQEGTHFRIADKNLRVNAGETKATLAVTVIKSGFTAAEAKDLWIEIHSDDLPSPIVQIDADKWWTTIKVGRE